MLAQPCPIGHGVVIDVGDDFAARSSAACVPRATKADAFFDHVPSADSRRQARDFLLTRCVVDDDHFVAWVVEARKRLKTARNKRRAVPRAYDDRARRFRHFIEDP